MDWKRYIFFNIIIEQNNIDTFIKLGEPGTQCHLFKISLILL